MIKNLIFDDIWESEGQGDQPSGSGGSHNRKLVSWNSRCKTDTSSVDTRGDLYDQVTGSLGGK